MWHPRDTVKLHQGLDKKQIDNQWYLINYFQIKNRDAKKSTDRNTALEKQIVPTQVNKALLAEYLQLRQHALLELGETTDIKIFECTFKGTVIHGLGAGHVRETAVTLHPLFGVPYIPASSLKGVVRNWALQAFFAGNESVAETSETMEARYFKAIFGTQKSQGTVQFYDIFFTDYKIVQDVLTVHFADYYGNRKAATDYLSPKPIFFYVVKPKLAEIYLSTVSRVEHADELLVIVSDWLEKALCELGIGSKTASGYGRFTTVTDITESVKADIGAKIVAERKAQAAEAKALLEQKKQEEYLATLSPGHRLVWEIEQLTVDAQDSQRSKGELYQAVCDLADQPEEQKMAAAALKVYWEKTNDWQKPSKKQKIKNQVIAEILGL